MEQFKQTVKNFAADETLEVNMLTHKLEQKTRNKVKRALLQGMQDSLEAAFADEDDIIITRMEKGIGIAFPTPSGYFPATIEITMKSTDLDVQLAAEQFAEKVAAKAALRQERMALKAEKMKADEIKREKKRAERAAKEAAKAQRE